MDGREGNVERFYSIIGQRFFMYLLLAKQFDWANLDIVAKDL